MGGPIVRTGATPEYSAGWDKIFGKKTASRSKAKTTSKAKSTKKKAAKKPPKKKSS